MIRKLFINKTDNIYIQFIRYSIIGGSMAILDVFLLYMLTECVQIYYLYSASISFFITVFIHFALSSKWVFYDHSKERYWFNLIGFLAIGIIGFVLNIAFLWFFTEKIAIYYMYSKIITIFLVYLFNFTARKFILFKR